MWKRKCFVLLIAAAARHVLGIQYLSLRWLTTKVFTLEAGALMCISARGIMWSPEGLRENVRDLKFAELRKNLAAWGLRCKTLFPPLVYLWYSSYTSYGAKDNSKKNKQKKHYSRVFTFIHVNCWALLSSTLPPCVHKEQSCKVKILICTYIKCQNSLSTKLMSQKLI